MGRLLALTKLPGFRHDGADHFIGAYALDSGITLFAYRLDESGMAWETGHRSDFAPSIGVEAAVSEAIKLRRRVEEGDEPDQRPEHPEPLGPFEGEL